MTSVPDKFLTCRLAVTILVNNGHRLTRDQYFPSGDLNTEEALDTYAACWAGNHEANLWGRRRAAWNGLTGAGRYMIARVQAHAVKHYEDGWDVFVECSSAEEVIASLNRHGDWQAMPLNDVIRLVAIDQELEAYNDCRNDARAAGGLETTKFEMGLSNEAASSFALEDGDCQLCETGRSPDGHSATCSWVQR